MPKLSNETHLHRIDGRREDLRYAEGRFYGAIRRAVKAGVPKIVVAKTARVSRPTLDRILSDASERM